MPKPISDDTPNPLPSGRFGLAVVELALALPLVVLVTFATIEICTALHKQQYLKIVAYEGARVGVTPRAESADVMHKCETLLQARNIVGYTITTMPTDPATLVAGDYYTITIVAPLYSHSLGAMFASSTLTERVTLRFE